MGKNLSRLQLVYGPHRPAFSLGTVLGIASATLTLGTQAYAADALQSLDKVSGRAAAFRTGAAFTGGGEGRSGQPSDSAAHFTPAGLGTVYIADGAFLNQASQNDEVTVSVWAKAYSVADSSVFWANSPSSASGTRGMQAHVPWSDSTVYFDSAGCCGGDTRLSANISTFPNYSGGPEWWQEWHHFIFSKRGENKQIWIDGVLFVEGNGARALPVDFTDITLGSENGNNVYRGLIDDFAVFSTQLGESDILALAGGQAANSLASEAGLLAYWDFNDPPSDGQITSVIPAPDSNAGVPNLIRLAHVDGGIPWAENNVSMKVDGVSVVPVFSRDGSVVTLSYIPPTPYAIQSTHHVAVTYPSAGGTKTFEWRFTVGIYTLDAVASRVGAFTGGSSYTSSGGGRSGLAGDYAVDFGAAGTGPLVIEDGSFLNGGAATDTLTFALWVKKYDIAAGSAFWAISPSSNNGQRGFQAHLPWDNNNIYFDTAGCCGGNQRLNGSIAGFSQYSGDVSWWNDWHHYAFVKNGENKEIWVDGTLFLSGAGASPLPQDFTRLLLGSDGAGGGLFHAVVDDFAVFNSALSADDIAALASGSSPSSLPAGSNLAAFWAFNDLPAQGFFLSTQPAPDQQDAVPNLIEIVHQQGGTPWDLAKVSLKVDGAVVSPVSVTAENTQVTVRYVPATPFAPKSSHTVELSYPGADNVTLTRSWSFRVAEYSRDVVRGSIGVLRGIAAFTTDGQGRSGAAGDVGVDMGRSQGGQSVHILDASFLNEAGANDEFTVAGWQKLYSVGASSLFWVTAPSVDGGNRGINAHSPWSDNTIYFDTAGCCVADQRINANINTFEPYMAVGDPVWWNDWHYMVYLKRQGTKEIWIDGRLFLSGEGARAMPGEFTEAFIGADAADGVSMQGVVDDVAFFKTALGEADIQSLAGGASPSSLAESAGLLAFWDFNDGGTPVLRITSIVASGNTLQITWTGGTAAQYLVEYRASLSTGNWTQVGTSANSSISVPMQGGTGFFRVTTP